MSDLESLLTDTARHVAAYRAAAAAAPVYPPQDLEAVRDAIGGPLPDSPRPAEAVIDQLISGLEPSMVAMTGPRYFGFVVGGALPAATAADIVAVGWDQLAYNSLSSPAVAVLEEVVGAWLLELLQLPREASFGFVTGSQAASTVCLAAARHQVLAEAGWDVERDGLPGSPAVRIVASEERHATIDRSLRLLGFGAGRLELVPSDDNGSIDVGALTHVLAGRPKGPTIVCFQAGNVNTGACDDLTNGVAAVHEHGGWAHVDGAFGLWAAASPDQRHLVRGIETADSWGADGHKWLNVPYDSGYAFCAHPDAHAAAMAYTASYLVGNSQPALRSPGDYAPESSRRARAVATWAAIQELGRSGTADLVDRCCRLAQRFATQLATVEGITIGNQVVLNQVMVRFADDDATTDRVIEAVQRSGECWMGGTSWKGRRYMRISVSNHSTTEQDVDRSVQAIIRSYRSGRYAPQA